MDDAQGQRQQLRRLIARPAYIDMAPERPVRLRRPAESPHAMTIPVAGLDGANPFAVAVQKLAQNQAKQEGAQVVAMIEQATPPVGPNGEGAHVNTYA